MVRKVEMPFLYAFYCIPSIKFIIIPKAQINEDDLKIVRDRLVFKCAD